MLKEIDESGSFDDDDDDDDDTEKLDLAGYDEEENNRYREFSKNLEKHSVPTLMKMLKKNEQKTTGNKDELIARIADGMVIKININLN